MKVTIKDIARAVGVSHPTVSKALNGAPGVSEEIRKKIISIAAQMNYIPNLAAKRLVDKQTNSIGLIWPKSDGLFFHHLSLQIQKEAAKRGLDVMISLADPPRGLRTFNEHFVDQIIFWCPPNWSPGTEFVIQKDLFRGRMLLMGGGSLEGTHRISVDRKGGLFDAVCYLAACGHRKITFVGDSSDKLHGFTKGVLEQRLEYHDDYVILTKEGEPFPERMVAELLANPDRPTAFVVDSQTYAFELLRLFRKRDIRIPEHFSLIVYDEIPEIEHMEVPLTTIGPSIHGLAVSALNIITEPYARGGEKWANIEIGCEMHIRKSVRTINTNDSE